MTNKIREHMENLFKDAPVTRKSIEIKEEITQNVVDKYNDLIEEGKNEETAFRLAVSSIGDITELVDELSYVRYDKHLEEIKAVKKKKALTISIAVGMYIISCLFPMLLGEIGIFIMFVFVAIATGLIIYTNISTSYLKNEDSMVEDFKEFVDKKHDKKAVASIKSAISAIALAIFFFLGFSYVGFHRAWVVFIISYAVGKIIDAYADINKDDK